MGVNVASESSDADMGSPLTVTLLCRQPGDRVPAHFAQASVAKSIPQWSRALPSEKSAEKIKKAQKNAEEITEMAGRRVVGVAHDSTADKKQGRQPTHRAHLHHRRQANDHAQLQR
ncbi:hypothetical protein TRVL_08056 [Trypanosoma vivax]|nr:hypothetical protein TRVL_08056 [Trypanosoma vivax]